ncbi:MAG: hypothetical protein ACREXU_21740 [Gammaproteobacteria bacterium]
MNIVHGSTVRLAVFRDGARAALTAPCWSCVSQENTIVFLPGKGTPFAIRNPEPIRFSLPLGKSPYIDHNTKALTELTARFPLFSSS